MTKFLSYIFPVFFLCLIYACAYGILSWEFFLSDTLVELISKWCEDLLEKTKNGRGQQPSTHAGLPLPTVLLIREIHVEPMCLDM